ncbi:MAG TPA: SGNH/GDSL hydrolase family protein [Casimicrobiaceae bacterium]|nr:SGNH/GDSL hydrolase family protein [Casimicrobiaceae bacterium]
MSESNASQRVASAPRVGPFTVFLVVLAAIALLLLAAEGAVRVRQTMKYGSADRIEDAWTVDRRLDLRVPVANYSNGRISVNSLGFRGPEIAMPKPPHTVRIAYLGASTTWCAEVSGNESVWPHLATASLADAFPGTRFDYVNAGVPGYTMPSILVNLENRVAPLQPDVIVIYEAANMLSGEMRERAEKAGIIEKRDVEVSSFPSRYSLLWYLVEKNLRLKAAQRNVESNRHLLEVDANSLGSEYRKALTQVVVAAQRSAKLVAVATFAIQPRAGQSREQQMRASESALFYMPFVTPQTIIDSYAQYNRIMREVAAEKGVLLIEGENDIPGDAVHFTDSVHFSDAGSALMARRISAALIVSPALREIVAASGS